MNPKTRLTLRIDRLLERMDARPSCLECVYKHLGSAMVLMSEVERGYPEHKLLAIGHLNEAEEESQDQYPELAEAIREARKEYQSEGETPDLYELVELMRAIGAWDDGEEDSPMVRYQYRPDSTRMDRQVCKAGVSQPCGDVCIPMRRNGKPLKCADAQKKLGFKAKSAFENVRSRFNKREQQLKTQAQSTRFQKKQLQARAAWERRKQGEEPATQSRTQSKVQAPQRPNTREYKAPKADPWKSQDYATRKGTNPNYNEEADKVLLGVGEVDARSLSKAYKSLARKYHPDVGGSTEKMQRVNQAYENLRKKYKLDARTDSAIAPTAGSFWVRMDHAR